MLKTWTLQHFKSVYDKTTLELAPLTIFSGANSSGKSTIIQSLLLTAQTLQNSVHSRPIILNGHILKVGAFNDIVSKGSEQQSILIGFQLCADLDNAKNFVSNFSLYSGRMRNFLSNIDCQFKFSASINNENNDAIQLQPELEECTINSQLTLKTENDKNNKQEEIQIVRSTKKMEEKLKSNKLLEADLQKGILSSLKYEVKEPKNLEYTRRYYRRLPASSKYIGASLNHFLPDRLSVLFNIIEEKINRLLEILISPNEYPWEYFSEIFELDFISSAKEFRELLIQIIEHSIGDFQFKTRSKTEQSFINSFNVLKGEFTQKHLFDCLKSLSRNDLQCLATRFSEKSDDLRRAFKIRKVEENGKFSVVYVPLPEISESAVDYIKQFFTHFLKYLGPLRDEPKAVYSLAGTTDSKDIGFRGEHTAAVLEVHRKTEIRYIPSKQFEFSRSTPETKSESLNSAVLDWLQYMGIANSVETSDKGVLGYELKVAISENESLYDLTHVGVGVSQVLPILVQSLLAEAGSTLIFEQPELHLHPKVQTRLADFFISMTMLKKQCIVETHSEYIINRLRYLSANSQDAQISKDVIIYFVEKQGQKSTYRPVRINDFGVIEGWPKGFFDESEQNSRAIIKAAMEKRKKNKL